MPYCSPCARYFVSDHALRQHRTAVHCVVQCEYCSRQFHSDKARQQHADAVHPLHDCSVCDARFVSALERDEHWRFLGQMTLHHIKLACEAGFLSFRHAPTCVVVRAS